MTTQAQAHTLETFCNPLRQSYRSHNPLIISADQQADLSVILAWNAIESEMAQALPTTNPYRNPLALLGGLVPMQTVAPLSLVEAWNPLIPSLDIPAIPPSTDPICVSALIETQNDLFKGRNISPSCKANLVDAWLEGQASWGEVQAAHAPKATYTQHLVRRAYLVLSFVGGYARVR